MFRSLLALALICTPAFAEDDPSTLTITHGLVLRLESTEGLVMTGDALQAWQDRSPRQNHVTALGAPVIAPETTPSGLAAIRFDGADDRFERVHATHPLLGFPSSDTPRTLFMVVRYRSASSSGGVIYGSANANRMFGLGVKSPGGELMLQVHTSPSNNLVSTAIGPEVGWLVQAGQLNDGFATLFQNGAPLVQARVNANTVLSRLAIGQDLNQTSFASFDLAAILLYNRALTSLERQAVELYLDTKYLATPENTPPTVSILAPPDHSTHRAGDVVTLTAEATDVEDGDISDAVAWDSDLDQRIGHGSTVTTKLLSIGAHVITASVLDSEGLSGIDSIELVVQSGLNTSPSLTIESPVDGDSFVVGAVVTFHALANDAEDGDLSHQVRWVSDRDGSLGSGPIQTTALSVGPHAVTATVTDSGGATATAQVAITIRPATNAPPTIQILEPADGATYLTGQTISFTTSAIDAEDGDLSGTVAWTSNLGGQLGSGSKLEISSLTDGTHLVTATVADSAGAEAFASVSVTVAPPPPNTAPLLSIITPATGDEFVAGEMIDFAANATDAEDDDSVLVMGIQWSSNRDGAIGTGAPLTVALSEGAHVVTATVADSGGLFATETISISVQPSEGLVTHGLVLHLNADEGVTEEQGIVSAWIDQSTFANDLQAHGVPYLARSITPAGGPAIRLGGTSASLQRLHATHPLTALPTGAANRTMFVVARYYGMTGTAGAVYGEVAPNKTFGLVVHQPTGQLALQGYGAENNIVTTTPGVGAGWQVQSARLHDGQATIFLEDQALDTRVHSFDTGTERFLIGQAIDGDGFVVLDLVAVLLYDRALSDEEHLRVVRFLQARLREVVDLDGDGLPDVWENVHFSGLHATPDADDDGDGLTNEMEYHLGLDPTRADSDGDGAPDGWEVLYQLNPYMDDADADPDGDGVSNIDEFRLGRNPRAGVLADGADALRLHVFQPAN